MAEFLLRQIGVVRKDEAGVRLKLELCYRGLFLGLERYSHVNVLWWFSDNDNDEARSITMVHPNHNLELPLQGIFATRSPMRPNPIALTNARVEKLDADNCVIWLDKIDARDGSPVVDVKPYVPRLDRVDNAVCPTWPERPEKQKKTAE
jgi:tRNA-Thr(GGU) m(6)t(6)A37 methyltransferase TsaA